MPGNLSRFCGAQALANSGGAMRRAVLVQKLSGLLPFHEIA
jgi:hypothetical protein